MTDTTHPATDDRAKVVVLVGFLGAGKTTLLRHLINSEEDMSSAVVIVNEFGEVGIDGSLVSRLDTDVIEMVSGHGDWEAWDGPPGTRLAFVGWNVADDEIIGRLAECIEEG